MPKDLMSSGWPIPDSSNSWGEATPPEQTITLSAGGRFDHAAALFIDHAGATAAFQGHAMGVGPAFRCAGSAGF